MTISSLEGTIPSIKNQTDYVRFNCLGVVNYTVQTLDGTITYTFGSSVFSTYVTEQYGLENSNTAQALLGPVSKVTLTPLTIFDDKWSIAFGEAFSQDRKIATQSAIGGSSSSSSSGTALSTNFFISDFACTAKNSLLTSSNGVVVSINANVIQVKIDGSTMFTLIFGACSNILVMNGNIPKIGQNVFWNGFKISSNTCQVYSGLFV